MGEWSATGRQSFGPGQRVAEVQRGGSLALALQFDREYRDSQALMELASALPFLENPGVDGLARLVHNRPELGVYVFDTGPAWPLTEVLRVLDQPSSPPREPAMLQLMAELAGIIEQAAHEAYATVGIESHGAVAPWRVALGPDGTVMLLGFGVPSLTTLTDSKLPVDAYRFAPPERFSDHAEDIRSDLFSIALIGLEFLIGEPLYGGDAETVRSAAQRGTARRRLRRFEERLAPEIFEFFDHCFALYPDARFADGRAFRRAALDLASSPRALGSDLAELMSWVSERDSDGPRTPEAPEAQPARHRARRAPTSQPRWEKVTRSPAPPTPTPRPTKREPRRERTRRRRILPDHNAIYPHDPLSPRAIPHRLRVEDGTVHELALDPSESLAKSAARVVDELEFSPVDLLGRIRGWYRLVQGDEGWFGDAQTSVLDPSQVVDVEFFRNRALEIVIEVPGEGYEPWTVTVGSAVHAQFLVGEIRRVLDLDGWRWSLRVDGHYLGPWQVLDDFDPQPGMVVEVVQRTRSR